MAKPLNALLIDDSALDVELLVAHLQHKGYDVTWERVDTAVALRAALSSRSWDIALCDYVMPSFSGLDALRILRSEAPDLPAITISGQIGEDYPVEVMRAGARDYVRKDNLSRLVPAIERELGEAEQQRRVEQVARASEQRFRAIFEEAPLGVALIDSLTGHICEVNPRFAQIAGRTRAEMTTIDWMSITHPDDVQQDLDNMALLNAGTIPGFSMNKRYRRPDGSYVWINMTVAPVSVEDKDRPRHLCMIEDITERKRMDRELQDSKQLMDSVLENIPLMIFLKEAQDLRFVMFNRAADELLGYDRKELLGKNDLDLFPPEQAAFFMAKDREVLAGGILLDIPEEPIQTSKQGQRLLHTRKVCIKGADGVTKYLLGISEDITERKQAEAELEKAREHYRRLLVTATDGIHVLTEEGELVEASPSFYRMLGYSPENPPPLNVSDWDVQWSPEELKARIARLVRQPEVFETRHRRRDGQLIDVEISARGMEIDGRPHLYASSRDITERKQAEIALGESEAKFARMFHNSPVAMCLTVADDGTYRDVNGAFERTTGFAREEVIGRTSFDLGLYVKSDDRERLMDEVKRRGSVYGISGMLRSKAGELRQILVCTSILTSGPERYLLSAFLDITELERAQEARRESEARFQAIIEASPVALAVNDADENITFVNRSFVKTFGYTLEDIPTVAVWWPLAYPDPLYRHRVTREWAAALDKARCDGTDVELLDYKVTCKDGSVRDIHFSVAPMGEWDLVIMHDVTERTRAEREIRALNAALDQRVAERTAELVAANAALESFAHSISHDLRAPLRHIEGFATLLEKGLGLESPEEQRRHLTRLTEAAVRMNQMISALLRLSQLGRSALEPRPLRLAEIVAASFADLRALTLEREVEFVVRQLPEVRGDSTLLRELFDNLLGNALKYTRPVAAPRIEVGSEQRDGQARFYVRDNGVGFDASKAEKLFGAFQRYHSEKEFEGTGVGLSVVKLIVEKHGGRIWVDSAPGQGATVWFTLG